MLLTYEGWGHRIYGKDKCQTDIFDEYLVSLKVPPPRHALRRGHG
ncbi:alpha/beta hydrolase [Nonomuraea dietziae]